MADNDKTQDSNENDHDRQSARSNSVKTVTGSKKKVCGRLVLLQGIRRLAMPSRSFSEGTQNVSLVCGTCPSFKNTLLKKEF